MAMPKTREEILNLLNGENALENLKALLAILCLKDFVSVFQHSAEHFAI